MKFSKTLQGYIDSPGTLKCISINKLHELIYEKVDELLVLFDWLFLCKTRSDWLIWGFNLSDQSDSSVQIYKEKNDFNPKTVMECLSSLILLFAGLSTPTTAPILTILMLISWQIKRLRPCHICIVVMYTVLVAVLMCEKEHIGGLFDCIRLSPAQMETNILLRVQYDPSMGFVRAPETMSIVFCPKEGFGNFFRAFLRYLVEPSYGEIYRKWCSKTKYEQFIK